MGVWSKIKHYIRVTRSLQNLKQNKDRAVPLTICGQEGWAYVDRVYDGDSCTLRVMWNHTSVIVKCRLVGIDTPELRGEQRAAGLIARDYVRDRIDKTYVWYQCTGVDKYGRSLVHLYEASHHDTRKVDLSESLNEHLSKVGIARKYTGGSRSYWNVEQYVAKHTDGQPSQMNVI